MTNNCQLIFLMLLSHLSEYACEWVYECNSAPIRNDCKKLDGVCMRSWAVRKLSQDLAKIRDMLLKSVRKAYSQHIRKQS